MRQEIWFPVLVSSAQSAESTWAHDKVFDNMQGEEDVHTMTDLLIAILLAAQWLAEPGDREMPARLSRSCSALLGTAR